MIIPFEKNRVDTEDIIIGSDWDNSYQICSSMVNEFNSDCEFVTDQKDWSNEWHQACSDFDDKWWYCQI